MAGKLCYGAPKNNCGAGTFRSSKAFADGVEFRTKGTATMVPRNSNPHQAGSDAFAAWDAGWLLADTNKANIVPRTGCLAPTKVIP